MTVNVSVDQIIQNITLNELEQFEKAIAARREDLQEFIDNNPPLKHESEADYLLRVGERYDVTDSKSIQGNFIVSAYYLNKKKK